MRISLTDATWCPGCGALVAPGATTCPKCGSTIEPSRPKRATRDLDLPEIGADAAEEGAAGRTGVMTRIESAIPPADDESGPTAARDRMPRARVFALAALLSVVVVGGATLLITHPWDPNATRTRASEPADTTLSGFPGVVETLSGQDAGDEAGESGQGDDSSAQTPLDALSSAHARLGELAEKVDASEQTLRDAATGAESVDAAEALSDARTTSIDVSNLIAQASTLSDDGGTYADDLQNLMTLGSWLRNRCDALTTAWGEAVEAGGAEAASDSVIDTLNSASDYKRLFEEHYDSWAPSDSDGSE